MTSKLVVNTIEADTGISSVSFASSISLSSTSKFFFSDAGINIGPDTNINRPATGVLGFNINSGEKVRIDSSGRLLIGTETNRVTRLATNSFSPKMQLEDNTEAAFSMSRFIDTAGPPRFVLQKARGTGASPVVVSNNDDIGQILFSGWDGDTFTNGAEIVAEVDGTPGDDQMPGRLIFKTNAGGTTNTERVTIGAAGSVTHYCGSGNPDGFYVIGNASQGRTTFAVRAGNTDSNASTSIRLQHSNGTSVGSLFLDNDSDNYNMMNAVQGGQIVFHTNESGSSLPKMRIHPDGDVQITSGNLVLSSGAGIDFSATSDSSGMQDELLDDYEEGSWTPTYDTSGSSGSITVSSYSLQYGKYIRIGRMVFVEGVLRANVTNNSNGTYDIGGLPFTITNTTNASGILHGKEQSSWTVAPDHFSCIANTTRARARGGLTVGASSYTNGNTSGFNSGSATNNRVYIAGCYRAQS